MEDTAEPVDQQFVSSFGAFAAIDCAEDMAGAFSEWRRLPVTLTELCINTTLRCGQSFR